MQRLDELTARAEIRTGIEQVPAHLEATYGIDVAQVSELDRGVLRIDRRDGPSWVARLFPAARPLELVRGDAEILQALGELGRRVERCAAEEPVTELEGQGLLVTELVPSVPRSDRRAAIRAAGGLAAIGGRLAHLGTLEAVRPAMARAEGPGTTSRTAGRRPSSPPRATCSTTSVASSRHPGVRCWTACATRSRRWTTARDCPRRSSTPTTCSRTSWRRPTADSSRSTGRVGAWPAAWALAVLLWSAGYAGDLARVDRVVAGYRHVAALEEAELERLAGMVRARPVVFACWGFCMGRRTLEEAAASLPEVCARADAIARRARRAFGR